MQPYDYLPCFRAFPRLFNFKSDRIGHLRNLPVKRFRNGNLLANPPNKELMRFIRPNLKSLRG